MHFLWTQRYTKRNRADLRSTLIYLIKNKNVDLFYVGNQGNFDYMVKKNLKLLKTHYPYINYAVVLAYMPGKKLKTDYTDYSDTIFPSGLEKTPAKYAILKRNNWMINKSDFVITYVKYAIGGAVKFKKLAEKKGKIVLNIADLN